MGPIWKKTKAMADIARKVEDCKVPQSNGKIGFDAGIGEYLILLNAFATFDESIPESIRQAIIWKAVNDAGSEGEICIDNIEKYPQKHVIDYIKIPMKEFILVSDISIDVPIFTELIYNGAELRFAKKLSRRFAKSRSESVERGKFWVTGDIPEDYMVAYVSVRARCTHEAGDRALKALDLYRGLWNMYINRPRYFATSYGKRTPINKIILGPLHSIHVPNGDSANSAIIYEPMFYEPVPLFEVEEYRDKLRRFTRLAMNRIRKIRYKDELEDWIIRYARSLDLRDWNSSLLQLWGLLEDVTCTKVHEHHTDTVRRASFTFKEHEYHAIVLDHLRKRRNEYVHGGEESDEAGSHIYQLKRYVESLLRFHVFWGSRFRDTEEVAQFLNMPRDHANLLRRYELVKVAQKYRGK